MRTHTSVEIRGVAVPRMFYGTAWKEDRTAELTESALSEGFRAIDTANQRKHYFEEAVGKGLANFERRHNGSESIFLQTKFTFQAGQDHRLPYDPTATVREQVTQSFASSQSHFAGKQIDSLILHGPMSRRGLTAMDWEAWRAMEAIFDRGMVRCIGVSNVTADQIRLLIEHAKVTPHFVQNRCYAVMGWDSEIRQICRETGLLYQGFSLLTANRPIFSDPRVGQMVKELNCTGAQLIYSFAMQLGMLVLTGTTNRQHIQEALQAQNLKLTASQLAVLETIAV